MLKAIDLFAGAGGFSDQKALERFAAKVQPEGECWCWTAGLIGGGYGQFHHEGKPHYAHRWLYERAVGPVAPEMTLDHLCRNRRCVRPKHLEVVTRGENVLRGESPAANAARATHCPAGHEYAGSNVAVKKDGSRRCATCHRERERQRYAEGRK